MKRFGVSLIGSILAFTAGLVTAQSWNTKSRAEMIDRLAVTVAEPCTPTPPLPPAPIQSFTVTPPNEFNFGQSGLKLVPERVQMKSESLGYDIDVSYPQILGTPYTSESKVGKVNQQIKDLVTRLYQWPLNPPLQMRVEGRESVVRNTVNFTYQIGLATDSFLSVNFIGYSYNGHTQHQLQDSFAANYDLTTGKHLKLSELFKPGSNYLHSISAYVIYELSKVRDRKLVPEALSPEAENFNVWQITPHGILFNFHGCRIAHCGEGDLSVEIPYVQLKSILVPDIPGKFKIASP